MLLGVLTFPKDGITTAGLGPAPNLTMPSAFVPDVISKYLLSSPVAAPVVGLLNALTVHLAKLLLAL